MTRQDVSITVRFTLPVLDSKNNKNDDVDGTNDKINDEGGNNGNYCDCDTIEERWDDSNCSEALMGLPPGIQPTKPKGGEYGYTGVHDHAPLPPPKEGGSFALLVGMADAARKHSDALLTQRMEDERARARGVALLGKRLRVEDVRDGSSS